MSGRRREEPMSRRFIEALGCTSLICGAMYLASAAAGDDSAVSPGTIDLPSVETFVLEPTDLDRLCIWVPVEKTGPIINAGCQPRENCYYSYQLPAGVEHVKTTFCPPEAARLLAEYTARYCDQGVPLTIFDGWRWEYSFSMCQFGSMTYRIPTRGGSWENSMEAVLHISEGILGCGWLDGSENAAELPPDQGRSESRITVRTFHQTRTRNGYPKTRTFH